MRNLKVQDKRTQTSGLWRVWCRFRHMQPFKSWARPKPCSCGGCRKLQGAGRAESMAA